MSDQMFGGLLMACSLVFLLGAAVGFYSASALHERRKAFRPDFRASQAPSAPPSPRIYDQDEEGRELGSR